MWHKRLLPEQWQKADAVFHPTGEESGGHWEFRRKVAEKWEMGYSLTPTSRQGGEGYIRFWVQTTPGRHLGIFPEGAAHWDWMAGLIQTARQPIQVLNLFGYTGLATLSAVASGAKVTHVDASKKSVTWARENLLLSGLGEKSIR